MKHVITRNEDSIEIQMIGMGKDKESFLHAFGGCTPEHQTCPSSRYGTLSAIVARPIADGVALRLQAREGFQVNTDEAAVCLDNAIGQVIDCLD